ncbi:MAG: hypothetical protein LKF79_08245 [Solobacterium sp.]|jgi:hypothetical protein|nr:hypothetical protein [Solobacterium sp.]MCH4223281.1 hypothetical protein [Solobacterium sp.]MCH4266617.1 hypothetical protein [Solobacterium sp.]
MNKKYGKWCLYGLIACMLAVGIAAPSFRSSEVIPISQETGSWLSDSVKMSSETDGVSYVIDGSVVVKCSETFPLVIGHPTAGNEGGVYSISVNYCMNGSDDLTERKEVFRYYIADARQYPSEYQPSMERIAVCGNYQVYRQSMIYDPSEIQLNDQEYQQLKELLEQELQFGVAE